MTISGPAPMLFAMYLVAAERQGATIGDLDGTLQTDIFKEYIAQKEWLFPPEPHLRLIGDLFEFCAAEVPRYHPVSVSGYHIREGRGDRRPGAGHPCRRVRLRRAGPAPGLDVDVLGSQLSFFFDAQCRLLRGDRQVPGRPGASGPGGCASATAPGPTRRCGRFHTQTAGVSLTAQQPDNNVVRTAVEALSAVLGGTQSLHTNASTRSSPCSPSGRRRSRSAPSRCSPKRPGLGVNVIDPLADPGTSST